MAPEGGSAGTGISCTGPSPSQIRRQVESIIGSAKFRQSRSLVKLLGFIVEETLSGRGHTLKEYVLGVNVFDRGPGFDPKVDTIVRVQARNLRSKLTEYYGAEGRSDPLILELPRGSYVPVFRLAGPEVLHPKELSDLRGPGSKLRLKLLEALVAATAVIAALGFVLRNHTSGPDLPSAQLDRLTFDTGFTGHPAVSGDGRWLAYASDREGQGATDIWVQATAGTSVPIRITDDPARDEFPDLSPDGSRVAFRSWRDGGGIWISRTDGSAPRLLVPGGYGPRFSPDGTSIVYMRTGPHDTTDRLYLIPADGGDSKMLRTHGAEASCAIWTPDGRHVLFVDAIRDDSNQYDWFVTSSNGSGPVVRVGLTDVLARDGIGPMTKLTCPTGWLGNAALFFARELRAVPISPRTLTVAGPSRTVLPAMAYRARVAQSTGGPWFLYYSLEDELAQLWSLPVSPDTGVVTGTLERLGTDALLDFGVSDAEQKLSGDGKTLWFVSSQAHKPEVCRVRLSDGRTSRMTTQWPAHRPIPDRTGERVLYQIARDENTAVFLADERGQREVCTDCGTPLGWLPDSKGFLAGAGGSLVSVDIDSGVSRELWKAGRMRLFNATLSPDAHWVALTMAQEGDSLFRGLITSFPSGLTDPARWIPIASEPFELYLAWSPGGNLVYFYDVKDGFRCLYAQELDRDKQPAGAPFAVQHFHRMMWRGSRVAVAGDRLILSLATRHSNIWRVRLAEGIPGLQGRFPFFFNR